jgi:hypothetical protein
MIKEYEDSTESVTELAKKTLTVSFTGAELMGWLTEKMAQADELKIFFGKYPKENPQGGKVTVILWPYKDGHPLTEGYIEGKDGTPPPPTPPYNNGTLTP